MLGDIALSINEKRRGNTGDSTIIENDFSGPYDNGIGNAKLFREGSEYGLSFHIYADSDNFKALFFESVI